MRSVVSVRQAATDSETPRDDLSRRRALGLLLAILVLALAIRASLVATATVTARDTATFVWHAQDLARAPLETLRTHDQHPLYPTLILAVHSVLRPVLPADKVAAWERSAQMAACLGGLAAVVALYVLTVQLFDRRIALLAAFGIAVLSEPCQLSADGLSDMPHLAAYLCAAAALVAAVRRGAWPLFAAAGALSAVAFLARPEGAGVAIVGTLAGLLGVLGPTRRRSLLAAAVCAGAFFALASPYMASTGRLVRKKSIGELFHIAAQPAPASLGDARERPAQRGTLLAADSAFAAAPRITEKYFRAGRVVFVLPMFLGLGWRRVRRPVRVQRNLIVAMAGLHLTTLVFLHSAYGYVSLRHVLVLAILTVPFSAAVLAAVVDGLAESLSLSMAPRVATMRRRLWVALLLVLAASTAPWTLRPLRADRGYVRRAGAWIRAHGYGPETVILTSRHRVAFYAGCRPQILPDTGRLDDVRAYLDRGQATLFVVEDRNITDKDHNPRFFEELAASLLHDGRLQLLHTVRAAPDETPANVLIYAVNPPPAP